MSLEHLCPHCKVPILRLTKLKVHLCLKCLWGWRKGKPTPLEAVSEKLTALRDGTHLGAPRAWAKEMWAKSCACAHPSGTPCDGPLQHAHLFDVRRYRKHPFAHHLDNRVTLCRGHHRALHRAVDNFDFQTEALRENAPPSDSHILSVAYLDWVLCNVAPRLQIEALRVGTLLEKRTRYRPWDGQEGVEVILYCRWLRGRGVERIADFKGKLFDFHDKGYERPGKNDEPGSSRTYRIKPTVMKALRKGPFVQVSASTLRALIAYSLEDRGVSRAEIRKRLRTTKRTNPSASTISSWVSQGRQLLAEASASPEFLSPEA